MFELKLLKRPYSIWDHNLIPLFKYPSFEQRLIIITVKKLFETQENIERFLYCLITVIYDSKLTIRYPSWSYQNYVQGFAHLLFYFLEFLLGKQHGPRTIMEDYLLNTGIQKPNWKFQDEGPNFGWNLKMESQSFHDFSKILSDILGLFRIAF